MPSSRLPFRHKFLKFSQNTCRKRQFSFSSARDQVATVAQPPQQGVHERRKRETEEENRTVLIMPYRSSVHGRWLSRQNVAGSPHPEDALPPTWSCGSEKQ